MLVPFHLSHHSASTAVSRGFFSLETLGVGLKFKVLGLQLAVIRDKLISLSLNFLIYKGKESACNTGDAGLIPGSVRSPWRRKWQPTPVFSPGEIYGLAPVHRFLQARILAGLPCLPSEDCPDPGIEFTSLMSPALTDEFFTTRSHHTVSENSCSPQLAI